MAIQIKKKNPAPVPAHTHKAEAQAQHTAQAVAHESVDYPNGAVQDTQEVLGEVKSSKPMATVSVEMGITRNIGNYESVRMTVGVTIPCEATEEELDGTYAEAKGWVEQRLEAMQEELQEQLGG